MDLEVVDSCSKDGAIDDGCTNVLDENDELLEMEMDEEERLEEQNNKEMEKLREKYEMEQLDQEIKEARFKSLLHLLEKSQFYAKYLENKVEKSLKEMARKPKKNKRHQMDDDYSEVLNEVVKKQKLESTTDNKITHVNIFAEDCKKKKNVKSFLTNIESNVELPVLLEGVILRDYQLQGLTWLKLLFETGMSGILADEMGLGKTVQVIALICHLIEKKVAGPFLVVAPLSTLPNWLIEFQRFAPKVPVLVYYGTKLQREEHKKMINARTNVLGTNCFPVVLTSYQIPIKDKYLGKINWKYIIVDEGHRLKNYKSLLARTLKNFTSINRLLLTGTPLQNNLDELWSLLHFLLPEIFDTLDTFQTWFQIEEIEAATNNETLLKQHNQILTVLHEILSPFLLRREKKDVHLQLPGKKEVIVYCPLTDVQLKLYESTVDKSIANLLLVESRGKNFIIPDNPDGTKHVRYSKYRELAIQKPVSKKKTEIIPDSLKDIEDSRIKIQDKDNHNIVFASNDGVQYSYNIKMVNIHFMLRKIVNHPYLIEKPVLPGSDILRIDENIVTSSGKLTILDGLLTRLKKGGHKVLLFSTMTTLLDIIEEFVVMRNYDYERLDGKSAIKERENSIKRYNLEDVFIFLLSTRAGGLGINLTSADTVVIFDSDWNPQADLQAQDRCHRIGQSKPVVVYRFVSTGTIDEKIVSRASAKRTLERLIIQRGKFKNLPGSKEMNKLTDLKTLMNEKLHSMEMHSNGSAFTDKQWEELLDRSDL